MGTGNDISAEFPFESRYVDVLGTKIHYVDEGSGDPVLFLHGNPTSSYIWRNIIPYLEPGARCVAMDLVGMGRSGKPAIEYRYYDHLRYVEGFIERMKLENITFVLHDWGSTLGLDYALRHPRNVKGLAFMEPIIMPIPSWDLFPEGFREMFKSFREPDVGWDMIVNKNVFVENVLPGGVARGLTEAEMEHYREPYLKPASRKPVWRWPNELPIEGRPQDVTKTVVEINERLRMSELPKLLFFGTPGAIMTAQGVRWCRENLRNLMTVDIGEGIHYLQEDNPHLIGSELAKWYGKLNEVRRVA